MCHIRPVPVLGNNIHLDCGTCQSGSPCFQSVCSPDLYSFHSVYVRKKIQKQYVRCEFEGCGKIVSNPQYLKRHMKYQHVLHRTFACTYPSCGRIFRFKTQMEEHEKLHS
ncbi:hypothetical protein scyTo_0024440, partial [Scyliorhinus torazame]|nr:hypothetical protein [Scyliorhinus torazame]